MSHPLVSHSRDLTRLVEEQYDIEIRNNNLLVHHVPFVTAGGTVEHGILVSELTTNGEATVQPGSHTIWLVGSIPYTHQGQVVSIVNDTSQHDFGDGLVAHCCMSGKPNGQHPPDYYVKVSNYVRVLSDYARAIDPSATHTDFPPRASSPDESVFRYHDAATSRAGLSAVTGKLRLDKVAIIGLGGTGAYILDLVAKTPVEEIHLYDDDPLLAHNAFRSPGAASLDELRTNPLKVDYLFTRYDPMRRNIVPHPVRVTAENLEELREMSFVFLAVDSGPVKRTIIEHLHSWNIPFIDCGMGVQRNENSLRGMLRVTTGVPGSYEHLERRISFKDEAEDEYDWNIQTADLNMMNAAMAVIRWKKLFGYYVDTKGELNSTYTVARNQMIGGDIPG
jgi:hypothetical protein